MSEEKKRDNISWWGLGSCILAIVAGVLEIGLWTWTLARYLGLLVGSTLGPAINLVGLLLGVIGVTQEHKGRLFPALGMALNTAIPLGGVIYLVILVSASWY